MFKRYLAAALTAAALAVAPAPTASATTASPFLRVLPVSEVILSGLQWSNDGGSTWTATMEQYRAGEADAGGDNGDGPYNGMFQLRGVLEWSSDGGSTWTATQQQYLDGEADAGGDNGDGPNAGTFRLRSAPLQRFSIDGGSTWRHRMWTELVAGRETTMLERYLDGEADAGGDNGDGPDAGTFRVAFHAFYEFSNDGGSTWTATVEQYLAGEHRDTGEDGTAGLVPSGTGWTEPDSRGTFWRRTSHALWSSDGGSTWTATRQQYLDGEADAGGDNGDGPNAGTFRYRGGLITTYACYRQTPTSNDNIIWPNDNIIWHTLSHRPPMIECSVGPRPTDTYTWNVDDGIEPLGDWCVSGRALDGPSIICQGEGYTYREAKRELGFGLGRP